MDPFAAWWRAHGSTYLACLAMGLVLLFGLILRIDAYNDDLGREADGGLGWGAVGRPLADWLYRLINSGEPTTGIAPLGLILAVAILALAATLLASAFRCRRPLAVALASAGLFAQPYGLANLSFQFDAPLMATAVLLALAAAWQGLRRPGLHWRGLCWFRRACSPPAWGPTRPPSACSGWWGWPGPPSGCGCGIRPFG